jgi:ribosomal protein S18 acetylase RimI-like enzyme
VGEFEPVGVRPEFRRRGLGAAACAYALERLQAEGGRQAIVYCVSEPACALYAALGFRTHAALAAYARREAADAATGAAPARPS